MKRFTAVIAIAMLTGCQVNRATPHGANQFRVESYITPGSEPETFAVETKIHELRGGTWQTIVMPRMIIRSGQSAFVIVGEERQIRVDATATRDADSASGSIKVDVSEHNQTLYGSKQQLTLATPRG